MKCPNCHALCAENDLKCGRCNLVFSQWAAIQAKYSRFDSPEFPSETESVSADKPWTKFNPWIIALLILILISVGWLMKQSGAHYAPNMIFADAEGKSHRFVNSDRPVVVGFWITQCGYSQRVMHVLNYIRKDYPIDKLDVIGFYLNAGMSDEQILAAGRAEGYKVNLAPAQRTIDMIRGLHTAFGIRGPGRDLYVVDQKGWISSVKADDTAQSEAEIEFKLRRLLRDKFPEMPEPKL